MWISFKDRSPTEREYSEGEYLITRMPGFQREGDSFENWRIWKKQNLEICYPDGTGHISHWWDGLSDMDLASKTWFENYKGRWPK